MMLLEVYYTIRFLKWQITFFFLKKANQNLTTKIRILQRKQEEVKKISSPYTLAATFG